MEKDASQSSSNGTLKLEKIPFWGTIFDFDCSNQSLIFTRKIRKLSHLDQSWGDSTLPQNIKNYYFLFPSYFLSIFARPCSSPDLDRHHHLDRHHQSFRNYRLPLRFPPLSHHLETFDQIMAAQQMFKSIEGHAFHFLHCWHELRHHPKWLMDQSTKKTKNTKNASPQSSPTLSPNIVNLDEENSVPSTFVGLERPPGRKAEKERIRKGKARDRDNGDSPLASVTMLLKFDEESTKRETRFERAYTQQQELIDIEKMKYTQQRDLIDIEKQKYMQKQEMIDIEKNKEEERIMTTNTTDMPPSLAKYYESRKAEILAKRALSEC
ncbi:uncharacterized protein LOC119984829 isoform X1 [Tripterygium wilfordii]|uniref:uncharacterized protein LOC119984829 isoform X1 n=1 Tax=Tripterygium wilfordii TaxID=458696 RepID=UPI0018F7EF44|nr:uncharacterized protein LOC119984829 isoform X1 [Tripterygium wilfordii]